VRGLPFRFLFVELLAELLYIINHIFLKPIQLFLPQVLVLGFTIRTSLAKPIALVPIFNLALQIIFFVFFDRLDNVASFLGDRDYLILVIRKGILLIEFVFIGQSRENPGLKFVRTILLGDPLGSISKIFNNLK
jgi:hypothetical protein